ncbi:MAG: tetraacyldisaccharide 4'-kinase [Planctomycetes bacterium]|nr:tetraacyldisaccharide 4'-kinase [Planctomycetota bacterium]
MPFVTYLSSNALSHPPFIANPFARAAAAFASPFYAAGVTLRNLAFDSGVRRMHKAHVPVISVGNLTAGGTGKTPMVIYLVQALGKLGATPAVLMRGYKADPNVGSEERLLLGEALGDTPIITDADRARGAQLIGREHPQVNVIVLDDGFQHRRLHRDLDLVLIDATNPFGYGHILPWGLMREPRGALKRADAIIVTRCDQIDAPALDKLDATLKSITGQVPLAHASHHWASITDGRDQSVQTSGQSVIVMCAIGNPRALIAQAEERFDVVESIVLPDHHHYRPEDLRRADQLAKQTGAAAVLTTHKDWVKLRTLIESTPLSVPVWRPHLVMRLDNGADALTELVSKTLHP